MLSINIITVGKLKESYLREACAEYVKRIGAYANIKITELSESRLPDNPSEKEIANCLDNESKAIIGAIPKDSAVIAMCIEGKQFSSVDYAKKIEKFSVDGKSSIALIIGSSFGMADCVKNAAQLKMSMSEMTFPHQLARVMILEQTYRALSILNNSKYHK